MKASRLLPILLAVAAVLPAQVAEFSASGTQSLLSNRDIGSLDTSAAGRSNGPSTEQRIPPGFRMTLNNWKFFGHEVGYAYNRTAIPCDHSPHGGLWHSIHQGFYDFLVYATPEGRQVRPFLAAAAILNYQWPASPSPRAADQPSSASITAAGSK